MSVMTLREKIVIQNFNTATKQCAIEAAYYVNQLNCMLDLDSIYVNRITITADDHRIELCNQRSNPITPFMLHRAEAL